VSDIDTAVVESLKALDPERPIREADKRGCGWIRVAELVAYGLNEFVENSVEAVRITNELRLPAFRFSQLDPYTWPRSR
jgi:hypothetical protein